MNIFGISITQGAAAVKGVAGAEATQAAAGRGVNAVHDSVALSVDGVRAAEAASDIRLDRVAAIRAEIASGVYETPEKLDIALDRLLDRLG
ncbi:MAG: flagellar biosynthesis anti-sigma factor FlgM [Planctomycetaceae bacterium]